MWQYFFGGILMAKFAELQTINIDDNKVTYIPDGGAFLKNTAMYPASTAEQWTKYADYMDDNNRALLSMGWAVFSLKLVNKRF